MFIETMCQRPKNGDRGFDFFLAMCPPRSRSPRTGRRSPSHLPLEACAGDDVLEPTTSLVGAEGGVQGAVPAADLDQGVRPLVEDRVLAEQVQGRQGRAGIMPPDGPQS